MPTVATDSTTGDPRTLLIFTRAGYTFTQVGVRHLSRRSGRATGAKLAVIARAFKELAVYAW